MKIETLILQNLISNNNYARKIIPFLKSAYFLEDHQIIFKLILKYVSSYNSLPTKSALEIEIDKKENESDNVKSNQKKLLNEIFDDIEKQDEIWLIDETEKWVKERAITIALIDSIAIVQGNDKKREKSAIPSILQDALAISFDNSIGHDYFEDIENRHNFYTGKGTDIIKIPFHLDMLNKATDGGYETKSLNIILGGTGGGKTLSMCDFAANALKQGYDCLYITLEMADMKIAQRIDANLLDVEVNELKWIDYNTFGNEIKNLKADTKGRLVVKEFPAGSVHAGHFRALLDELKLKKDFEPKIIFIDYLNLCASSRYKYSAGSYDYVKGVAEELRGLGMEKNMAIWSATQFNRDGISSNDPDVTNTSESIGLAFTADFMIGISADEQLKKQSKMLIKQIAKNRYESIDKYPKFMVGCNWTGKMKLYDLEK